MWSAICPTFRLPHYVFTPFVEFIVKAWQNPDVPFFLCLDEMNLAPVEEYFAEYLSAIESRSKDDNGEYVTDPIIKPFNEFGNAVAVNMINELNSTMKVALGNQLETQFRNKGLTLPENLIVIGTVNMDETTFSFSRKVLDRAMSIEMNKVDYDSYLIGATDNDIKDFASQFEGMSLDTLLVNRKIDSQEVVKTLGEDAKFVIEYLKQVNTLLDGTQFKLGYRAANEALLYVNSARDFGEDDCRAALDNFTVMKILSRIEGDSTKLKLDKETNAIQLEDADIDADEVEKQQGELNILTALRYIITQKLGEYYKKETTGKQEKLQEAAPVEVSLESNGENVDDNTEDNSNSDNSEQKIKERKVKLNSIRKIDSMIAQLKRDHFVSFWN